MKKEIIDANAACEALMEEYNHAIIAVKQCKPSFHYGIFRQMIDKGFIAYGGDSTADFCKVGGKFSFKAVSWNGWNVCKATWVTLKSGGVERLDISSKAKFVQAWIDKGLSLSDIVSAKRDPHYDKEEFHVYAESGSTIPIAEFDNFNDAKEFAYKEVMQRIESGRARRDDTSRYYHLTPHDVTKYHYPHLVHFEYYAFDEHEFGIYVI